MNGNSSSSTKKYWKCRRGERVEQEIFCQTCLQRYRDELAELYQRADFWDWPNARTVDRLEEVVYPMMYTSPLGTLD